MISLQTKIHDRLTLEFKVAFKARKKQVNDFLLNTWIFLPDSLDINPRTYKRDDFYKDLRTNFRLITPVFLCRELAQVDALPMRNLEKAMKQLASSPTHSNIAEYEYQIKMFSAIFKSSIRDQLHYILGTAQPEDQARLISEFLDHATLILQRYRELAGIIKTPTVEQVVYNYFVYGDEFMSNLIEKELFAMIDKLGETASKKALLQKVMPVVMEMLENEKKHKVDSNYPTVKSGRSSQNTELIFRLGSLKKYIESDLFLNANKKRDGVMAEQVYYSMAAGISMVFATAVAFSIQLKYGSFTMPLFVALVISYMLKDRIKELMRYYFAHKIGSKYFDNKTTISIKDKQIGWSKEGFDFIDEIKVPREIIKIRNRLPLIEADNRYSHEKIILYRKSLRLNRQELDQSASYNVDGVNEIIRLNLSSFMRKMDDPEVPLFVLDENNEVRKNWGIKNYYLNIIMQFRHEEDEKFKRFRIGFNRVGINSIEEMKA
ncbi:MAG TPA: hypothetical protein VK152_02005 [Paludibacter sp.]|nr:hypothetical protein [Paludibacter sp.]